MPKVNYNIITESLSRIFNADIQLKPLTTTRRLQMIKEVKTKQVEWFTHGYADNHRIHWYDPEGLEHGWLWNNKYIFKTVPASFKALRKYFTNYIVSYLKSIRNKNYYIADLPQNQGYVLVPKFKTLKSYEEIDYIYFGWDDIEVLFEEPVTKRLDELKLNGLDVIDREEPIYKNAEIDRKLIYKTLVMQDKNSKYFAFAIPVDSKLNYSKAAKLLGTSRLKFVSNLYELTGSKPGSCSLLGLNPSSFTLVMPESVLEQEHIWLSTGRLTYSMRIPTNMLEQSGIKFIGIEV